jgi:hypothetical protein
MATIWAHTVAMTTTASLQGWEVPLLIVDRSTDPHTFIRVGELPPWAGVLQPGL